MSARQHGTSSGYTGGCRCDDCREAQRLYIASYRNSSPARRQNAREWTAVRGRAVKRLIANHSREYTELLAEERAQRVKHT